MKQKSNELKLIEWFSVESRSRISICMYCNKKLGTCLNNPPPKKGECAARSLDNIMKEINDDTHL